MEQSAYFYGMGGLGLGPDGYEVTPEDYSSSAGGSSKPFWQALTEFVGKASTVINQAKPAITDIQKQIQALKQSQNVASSSPQSIQTNQSGNLPVPSPGMSTGTKVLLGVGAVGLAIGVGVLIHKAAAK